MFKTIIISLVLLFSFPVAAEETRIELLDGKEFLCFDKESAYGLLQLKINYPKLEQEVTKLKDLNGLYVTEIQKHEEMNKNLISQTTVMKEENAGLQKKLADANKWYNSKWLWTAIGVVVGSAATILVFEVAK